MPPTSIFNVEREGRYDYEEVYLCPCISLLSHMVRQKSLRTTEIEWNFGNKEEKERVLSREGVEGI